MKKINYILSFWVVIICFSCEKPISVAGFEDIEEFTIYDYIVENKDQFSSFLSILEKGGLDKTLSAYNPHGTDYTLFLPNNAAIDRFLASSNQFSSLNEILNDSEFAAEFSRFHVVNMGIHSGNFPFGAFPEPTLSGDFLTVSFIVEKDTSYYKINNQAAVIYPDIEVSNGFIHLIQTALEPVNITSYNWLELNPDYSIFKAAVDLTGFNSKLDINIKANDTIRPITLLVESNMVFNKFNITSVDDLIAKISPEQNDYTSTRNPLYNFIGYHILNGNLFIDDFEGVNTNYTTLSDIPLGINGTGIDFAINKGKEMFDTLIVQGDSVFVDYIGFLYDESNITTQSGVIHKIDKLMKQQTPSRTIGNYQFLEEPLFNQFRLKQGSFLIEEEMKLIAIDWTGADLYFVNLGDEQSSAWNSDYLQVDGDFEISYQISPIIQGKYNMFLGAERYNSENAVVEVFVDGNKVGGFLDLTSGGTANSPFQRVLVGTVVFNSYRSHEIEIKSLIPGRFLWDYIRFEPI